MVILTTQYIKNYTKKKKYFSEVGDRIHIDLRDSRGYTNRFEKFRQNDSDLVLKSLYND